MILINPIPGQEEENAEFLERNNLGIWIKKNEDIEEVLKGIIKDSDRLEEIRQNVVKFAKPNAAKEICSKIHL